MITTKKSKTAIALSGGVDSSVAAAILKKEGHSLVAVFMRFWSGKERNRCCDISSQERARSVSRALDIPFYVVDMREEFKRKVVLPFITGSANGVTPNPCVFCNRDIKFGALFNKLSALSVDYIATGHYVIKRGEKLFAAKDKEKDQSYFLWSLKKEQIRRSIFPLGEYYKEDVRKMAKEFSLSTESIPDSQELCFVGERVGDFLSENISPSPGNFIDKDGSVIGKHKGSFLYTIGQRKGIGLSGGPYYVAGKSGTSVVITKDEKDLYCKEVPIKNMNIIGEVNFPMQIKARIRYTSPLSEAILEENKLTFITPQRAASFGQSAVFYKNDELIGGAIIGDY